MSAKTTVAAMLGGVLFVGGALSVLADARSDCEKRVSKAEQNLQHEIDRHGENGKNVDKRRQDLERERENCRMYEQNSRREGDYGRDNRDRDDRNGGYNNDRDNRDRGYGDQDERH